MELNKIVKCNVLEGLPWPDQSIDCFVTSPPYWGLRDYNKEGQLGLEKTPEEYIEKMVRVFQHVRRCLKNTGTLWLNIGDTYFGGKGANGASDWYARHSNAINKKALLTTGPGEFRPQDRSHPFLKPKDLVGIPWMLAFALRADGWYLRQDIIWAKPNPMPESINDRCTKSHEYLFLFSKSKKYFFDAHAISMPLAPATILRLDQDIENQKGSDRAVGKTNGNMKTRVRSGNKERKARPGAPAGGNKNQKGSVPWEGDRANKRSVWNVSTNSFKGAHFATFPPDLIVDCIKAGCPRGGVVADNFIGSGTTAIVARKLERNFVGTDLNENYIAIAEKRISDELGLFK